MSFVIKICGLRTAESLDVALHAGADMVGFVFFPPSPRHVDASTARASSGAASRALAVEAARPLRSTGPARDKPGVGM